MTAAQDRLVEVETVEARVVERASIGAAKTFRPYDHDQVLLMAPLIHDWVPDGLSRRFVADLVDAALDLSAVYAAYVEGRGFPPYDPRLMVKLLVYGYATGMPSSRQARARDPHGTLRCGFCAPISTRTSARSPAFASATSWRRRTCSCRRCGCAGRRPGRSGRRSPSDGTKLRANASRHKAMSYGRMVKAEAQLELRSRRCAPRSTPCWLTPGESMPLRTRVSGSAVAATSCPTSSAPRRTSRPDPGGQGRPWRPRRRARDGSPRRDDRARQDAAGGHAMGASRLRPKPEAQRNFNDPESDHEDRRRRFHQCFNGQAVVDSATQVIVAAELSDPAPDARMLDASLEQLGRQPRRGRRRAVAEGRRWSPTPATCPNTTW